MATETLRPSAAGDECNLPGQDGAVCPNHYQNVDEAVADDGTTTVRNGTLGYLRDLYNLPASGVGAGTINFIKVHFRCYRPYYIGYVKPVIKSNSTVTEGTQVECSPRNGPYTDHSEQWNTNPADSAAWEWADIDALQIGVALITTQSGYDARCTQVYVEVDYTVGGIDYPISLSPGLTVSATIDRDVAWDRGMSPGLTVAVTIAKVFNRLITTAANLTVSVTIAKLRNRTITTSADLTISATIGKLIAYKRAVSVGLTAAVTIAKKRARLIVTNTALAVSVTIAKRVAFKRSISTNLTTAITIVRVWGANIATTANLTISIIISKRVAYTRTISAGLTTAVSLIKSWGIKRITAANLVLSVIITRSRGFNITTTANLTVSVVIHYCVVLRELMRIPIDALDITRLTISRMVASRLPLGKKGFWKRRRTCE